MKKSAINHSDTNPVQRILAAAKHCYLRNGLNETGMREIADEAGIARSTLYRYFPTRNDVLIATIKEDMLDANDLIHKKVDHLNDPADLIVEGLLLALKEIPKRPLLNAIFVSDEDAKQRRVVWGSGSFIGFGEELMAYVVQPAIESGLLQDKVKPEILIEWVYRILLSFLTLPSNAIKDEKTLRTTLHALLIPVLLH